MFTGNVSEDVGTIMLVTVNLKPGENMIGRGGCLLIINIHHYL